MHDVPRKSGKRRRMVNLIYWIQHHFNCGGRFLKRSVCLKVSKEKHTHTHTHPAVFLSSFLQRHHATLLRRCCRPGLVTPHPRQAGEKRSKRSRRLGKWKEPTHKPTPGGVRWHSVATETDLTGDNVASNRGQVHNVIYFPKKQTLTNTIM